MIDLQQRVATGLSGLISNNGLQWAHRRGCLHWHIACCDNVSQLSHVRSPRALCSADRDNAHHTGNTPCHMPEDGRYSLSLSHPPSYWCPLPGIPRSPTAILHRLGAVDHLTQPAAIRVPGLGGTGFKSMSCSGLSIPGPSPSHGDTPAPSGGAHQT